MYGCRVAPFAVAFLAAVACARGESGMDSSRAADSVRTPGVPSIVEVRCYRSSQSVLLGPPVGRRNVGHPPGWIRLEWMARGDSGAAQLTDANGAGFGGQWMRLAGDSLRVVGADDFLRTELRLVVTTDSLRGRCDAHSDADIERDSAGKPGDVRRAWQLHAVRAACDSMPRAHSP
jgi:hypothetical protein